MSKYKLTIDYGKVDKKEGDSNKTSPKSPVSNSSPSNSPKDTNQDKAENLIRIPIPKRSTSSNNKNKETKEGLGSAKSSAGSIPELSDLTGDEVTTPGTTPGALRKSKVVKDGETPKGLKKSTDKVEKQDTDSFADKSEDSHKIKPKRILEKWKSFSLLNKKTEEDQPDATPKDKQLAIADKGSPKKVIHQEKYVIVPDQNTGLNTGVIDGFVGFTVNSTMSNVNQVLENTFNPFSFDFNSPLITTYQPPSAHTVPVITEVTKPNKHSVRRPMPKVTEPDDDESSLTGEGSTSDNSEAS